MITIKNKNFVKIKHKEKIFFGGNQSWWKKNDIIMSERGCGVIALCNLELYLNGVNKKGITYDEYKTYVNKRYKEDYFLGQNKKLERLGLLPTTMENGLDKYFASKNIDPIISWAPTVSKKRIRVLMEKMLQNNIPIVASYYVFFKRNKLPIYRYNEELQTFERAGGIKRHYFNIVGITRRDDRDLLVISTWGERYYAFYDQWIKKLSIFSNILYVE